jgi:hypothetical protein
MKFCLLSPNNIESNIAKKYWKGKNVDNIFIQIKKTKSPDKIDKK